MANSNGASRNMDNHLLFQSQSRGLNYSHVLQLTVTESDGNIHLISLYVGVLSVVVWAGEKITKELETCTLNRELLHEMSHFSA